MKTTNTCPKCSSRQVVKVVGKISTTHKFNYGKWGRHEKFDRYVCTRCGHIEIYAQLSDRFKKWAKKNMPKDISEEGGDFV